MKKEIEKAAVKWVFETNGEKWSNNDNTAGDNYGSFIAGAKWAIEFLSGLPTQTKKDRSKTTLLNKLNVPGYLRSPFVRWAQKWGVWDRKELKWYEYSPLERHQKASRTMEEMWLAYQNK
jgi:hypothetical protein